MRKKLIDSSKSDLKKYMMIVESAGKVPASTEEDFTLEDIENPYFQGDEDTEESEGNRYYLTVGVKIGGEPVGGGKYNYFPELVWDIETGTEIEFDKLDKISKKAIQDKCDKIGSQMSMNRDDIYESSLPKINLGNYTEILDPELSDFKTGMVIRIDADTYGRYTDKVGIMQTDGMTMRSQYLKTRYKVFKAKMPDGDVIDVRSDDVTLYKPIKAVTESTQVIVKALMQKFQISESRAKQIVAKVSESIGQKFKVYVKLPNGETHWVEKEHGNFSTVSKEQDATPLSQEDVDAFKAKYGTRFDVAVKPTTDVKKFPKTQKISSLSISKTLADNRRLTGDLSIKRLGNDLVSVRQGGKEVCSVTAAGFSKLEFPDQIVAIHTRMTQGTWTGKYTFSLEDEFTGTFSLKDENNKEVLSLQTV